MLKYKDKNRFLTPHWYASGLYIYYKVCGGAVAGVLAFQESGRGSIPSTARLNFSDKYDAGINSVPYKQTLDNFN